MNNKLHYIISFMEYPFLLFLLMLLLLEWSCLPPLISFNSGSFTLLDILYPNVYGHYKRNILSIHIWTIVSLKLTKKKSFNILYIFLLIICAHLLSTKNMILYCIILLKKIKKYIYKKWNIKECTGYRNVKIIIM